MTIKLPRADDPRFTRGGAALRSIVKQVTEWTLEQLDKADSDDEWRKFSLYSKPLLAKTDYASRPCDDEHRWEDLQEDLEAARAWSMLKRLGYLRFFKPPKRRMKGRRAMVWNPLDPIVADTLWIKELWRAEGIKPPLKAEEVAVERYARITGKTLSETDRDALVQQVPNRIKELSRTTIPRVK